jgi:hypothetical protein
MQPQDEALLELVDPLWSFGLSHLYPGFTAKLEDGDGPLLNPLQREKGYKDQVGKQYAIQTQTLI